MGYSIETDLELVDHRFAVTDMLIKEGVAETLITLSEARAMKAVATLLERDDSFYVIDVSDAAGQAPGLTASYLRRFEHNYTLITGTPGEHGKGKHRTRQIYAATELGRLVFGLFTPNGATTQ